MSLIHCFFQNGAVEGRHFLETGKLVSLSEQNLIDCSSINNTCDGGSAIEAIEYIKTNGGVDTEESYRYKGEVIIGTLIIIMRRLL